MEDAETLLDVQAPDTTAWPGSRGGYGAHRDEFIPVLAPPPEIRRLIYTADLDGVDERRAGKVTSAPGVHDLR